jgi:succinate dehydrogenase/fumarate reductase iron-sulfur protein
MSAQISPSQSQSRRGLSLHEFLRGRAVTTRRSEEYSPKAEEGSMADAKKVIVMVKRQGGPEDSARWEEFSLKWHPSVNVIICLRDIAENPVTRDGKKTTPISYDSNCLEEICGSCAMLINGKARMACSALVDKLEQPIRIKPLSKFPLVRDLTVDRQFMFESPKRVKPWIPIDGTYDLGEGPPVSPEIQEQGYPLSNCISCGNCLEVCPRSTSTANSSARPSSARSGSSTCIPRAR